MIEQIMRYCRNVSKFARDTYGATYDIRGGSISLPFLSAGQHYWIEGSVNNDGLHVYPGELTDETFNGYITSLAIPKAFIDMCSRIEEWCETNREVMNSPYQSESFGGYSYTKSSNGWQAQFDAELAPWRCR